MANADEGAAATLALKEGLLDRRPKEADDAASPDAITLTNGATAAPAASNPYAVALTAGAPGADDAAAVPDRAAVPENTCCGLPLAAPHTAGPFLKFWGLERVGAYCTSLGRDPRFSGLGDGAAADKPAVLAAEAVGAIKYTWVGSLLLVTQAPQEEVKVVLQMPDEASPLALEAEHLEQFGRWRALRFKIRIPQPQQETQVFYDVTVSGQPMAPQGERFSFYITGSGQPAHWGFYSCSGFTCDVPAAKREEEYRGMAPLWRDVLAVHREKPLHLLVGGGDQLYCDDVWTLPSLKCFLDLPRDTPELREAKRTREYDSAMRQEVDAYYFHHYCCHFAQAAVGDAYARVPQIMTWDDHDIFDGWGSYPAYLQQSAVFQGIFQSANKWYSVFQQHCRPQDKPPVSIYEVGARTALVVCDQRHRRRKDQILPLEHYMEITELCRELPKGIEHVVFVSTVPVVYPDIKGARSALHMLRNRVMKRLLLAMGMGTLLNAFGEPELLDDLDDHWCAPSHHDERRFLVEHLQMLAKYRGCRVSLLSGDVHVCGAGYLASHPEPPEEQRRHDFRYMAQIISSAIANPPPPGGLMKAMDLFGARGRINKATKHEMSRVIKAPLGVSKPLENKRNWCEVIEQPLDDPTLGGYITFRLRVEESPGSTQPPRTYDIPVPPLDPLLPGTDEYYDVHAARHRKRWCF